LLVKINILNNLNDCSIGSRTVSQEKSRQHE
jgi:hypothetical protein